MKREDTDLVRYLPIQSPLYRDIYLYNLLSTVLFAAVKRASEISDNISCLP